MFIAALILRLLAALPNNGDIRRARSIKSGQAELAEDTHAPILQQRIGLQPAPWPFRAVKPLTDQDTAYQALGPEAQAQYTDSLLCPGNR